MMVRAKPDAGQAPVGTNGVHAPKGNPGPKPSYNPDRDYLKSVPAELRERRQWVVWRYRVKKNDWTKVPFAATIPPSKGSTTDPSTWRTFDEALDVLNRFHDPKARDCVDGIGFVFSPDDPYVGIDFDDALDDGGFVKEWAKPYLDRLPTYAEVSPSARGFKLIARGSKPGGSCKKNGIGPGKAAIEIYEAGRYFTMTGDCLGEQPTGETVENIADAVSALHADLFPPKPVKPKSAAKPQAAVLESDDDLLRRMFTAKNGADVEALFKGDTSRNHHDESSADLALCNCLAFWFRGDEAAIDRVFRLSGLMRDKWDERRGETTYGARTIAKALEGRTEYYEPRKPSTNGKHHETNGQASHEPPPADGEENRGQPPNAPHEAADDPHRLARVVLAARYSHPDGQTLRFWQGQAHHWDGAYQPVADKELNAGIAAVAKADLDRINVWEVEEWEKRGHADELGKAIKKPAVRKVSNTLIGNVATAISGYTLIRGKVGQPSWLVEPDPFPAAEVLPTPNALIHLPGFVAGNPGAIIPPTPLFFCPYAVDYDFDAQAPQPENWFQFLCQVFLDDPKAIAALREWFGYQLTPDTSHQKIAMLIGPKRSGKGTIARVMTAMIGRANVANPTLASLGMNFGLAPLIGKPTAIITDARLSGRSDIAQIVERLLSISGEDGQTIDRKHQASWTGRLPTRFTVISNELPRLTETSGALAGRMVVFPLTQSFYGREDRALESKLMPELPGILLWAIEGWKRLRDRGHFVQPESGKPLVEELEELASPVGTFVKERCEVGADRAIKVNELYQAWCEWCKENGREHHGDKASFGRNLRAVVPSLKTKVEREEDSYVRSFVGIDLEIVF